MGENEDNPEYINFKRSKIFHYEQPLLSAVIWMAELLPLQSVPSLKIYMSGAVY